MFATRISSLTIGAFLGSLLLFIQKAQPLAINSDVGIEAIRPGCTNLAGGSTSCHVGVNPVPPDPALAGGDLSPTTITLTESGSVTTIASETWTASETNFLGVTTISSTDSAGSTVATTSTQYISFITTTQSSDGAVGSAVIGGVVIAPALVPLLQTIADSAAGKSTEDLTNAVSLALTGAKVVLPQGDITRIVQTIAAVAALGGTLKIAFKIAPYLTFPPSARLPIPTPSSSSSEEPIVTAAVDPPYTNWEDIKRDFTTPSGPTPTEDDLAPTPSCSGSNTGTDPGFANQLAAVFCDPSKTDFKQDASKELSGSDLDPKQTNFPGISILFDYKHDTGSCSLDCVDNYKNMINTCESVYVWQQLYELKLNDNAVLGQFNSHTFNGGASVKDGCGSYNLTISNASTPPRTQYAAQCADHSKALPFDRKFAQAGVEVFCSEDLTLNVDNSKSSKFLQNQPKQEQYAAYSNLAKQPLQTLTYGLTWSAAGQAGCNPQKSYKLNQAECTRGFLAAIDDCDTTTTTAKYGSSLIYSGPNGCISFTVERTK
ncbi:MAG: hypothetical protein M1824_006494 [Vezdaea acicularis]|nr:MAG: hypothetical protein M1824_006494 [Vezdaea acicularis]